MTDRSSAVVAVIIKTLRRERAFFNCVRSVDEHIRMPYRFYIADDGPVSADKEELYARLEAQGHFVLRLNERSGASECRNKLLQHAGTEPYVLRMDDDFELTAATDLPAMVRILEHQPDIGAVADLERQVGFGKGVFSGDISPGQGRLEIRDGTLTKRLIPLGEFVYHESGGVRYAYCEFSRNFLLIRRSVFETVRWEIDLPFAGEHADFLLQLRQWGWKVAFLPDSLHLHREDLARLDADGMQYRRQKTGWDSIMPVYDRKWGVKRIAVKRPARMLAKAAIVRLLAPIVTRFESRGGVEIREHPRHAIQAVSLDRGHGPTGWDDTRPGWHAGASDDSVDAGGE